MRNVPNLKVEKYRIATGFTPTDGMYGAFRVPHNGRTFMVIASDGEGWDHVSVSLSDRCPTWDEMAYFKGLFFKDDETVIQYHPAANDYVNNHRFCLHLWRPQDVALPTPDPVLVGVKEIGTLA